jgi:hypothetical protein
MASTYEWAQFFGQTYAVFVDGQFAHDASFTFTPHSGGGGGGAHLCLAVAMTAPHVQGNCAGFFHLVSAQCADHLGSYQKNGPLDGGAMECHYSGPRGDTGYFRVGFWEVPSPKPGLVLGEWRGSIFLNEPHGAKQSVRMTAKTPKKRPDTNYPWNR